MLRSIFKKLLLCLLVLALLPINALAENWFSALFGDLNSDLPKLRFVPVVEMAFSDESGRVIAAMGDGQKVLIMNAYEVYLWDTVQNKRLPLTFSNEEEIADFNSRVDTAVVRSLTSRLNKKEQREEKATEIRKVKASYLKQYGLEQFTSFDHISKCFPHMVPIGATVEYLSAYYAVVAANQLGIAFLANLQTGECSLIESVRDTALCEDRLLVSDGIRQLTTGETYVPAIQQVDGSGFNSLISRIELMKDDSILMLIPSNTLDTEDYSREMFLVDSSTERSRITDLGKFSVSGEPTRLLVTSNERYVAAFSPTAYYMAQAVIIDRESGETKSMDGSLLLVAAAENAFICYDYNDTYMLVMLDPETMERTAITISGLSTGTIVSYTVASSVIGNGEGLYFVQREIMHGYFELENNG